MRTRTMAEPEMGVSQFPATNPDIQLGDLQKLCAGGGGKDEVLGKMKQKGQSRQK